MIAWLIYYKNHYKKNLNYILKYYKECFERKISLKLIFLEDLTYGIIDNNKIIKYKNEYMAKPDFVIMRAINPILTKHLELMGIRVYNNSNIADICNDKQKTYQTINELEIPIINSFFYRKKEKCICDEYPKIVKPTDGAGGKNVFLVRNQEELNERIAEIDNNYILQDVADRGKDLRVYVIGKQIIAAMLRHSRIDFRANYSLGGNADIYNLNSDEVREINRIIQIFDIGLVGIDFIFYKGRFLFNEIEDVVGSKMLYEKTRINIVSLYIDFIISDLRKH